MSAINKDWPPCCHHNHYPKWRDWLGRTVEKMTGRECSDGHLDMVIALIHGPPDVIDAKGNKKTFN